MLRNRLLILLGGCFLAASAAWADDVGFVDCSNHPEDTPVFGKPRKTPEVVASLRCGERFTILVYGFVFSRIQTGDGKVGYVYSNLLAVDRAATAARQGGSVQLAAEKSKLPSTSTTVAKPAMTVPAQPQPAPAQPAPAQAPEPIAPAPISNVPDTTATVSQPNLPAHAQPQPAPAQPAAIQASVSTSPSPISNAPATIATVAQPNPPAPMDPQPASAGPAPASDAPVTSASAVAQPERTAPTQPEPASAQPPAPSFRPANDRTSWEKPRPSGVRRAPLIELYGGYAFARLSGSGGTSSNLNGAMGSFGWNVKPWLQIVADSSYSVVTVSGVKNVLYGNHFGPRYFHRGRNRWGVTPFVEALVGGSRSDTIISGTGGYTTSQNTLSYKAGGGLDIHPSRHIDIRLFDVDYYRTSFGTNLHQNNYWASAGIVLRLFGGRSE